LSDFEGIAPSPRLPGGQAAERIAAIEALIPTLTRASATPPAIDWAALLAEVGPAKP